MICPSDDTLLLAELGDLTVNEARDVEHHGRTCSRCEARRSALRELLADLRARPHETQADTDEFTTRVMASCRAAAPRAPLLAKPRARVLTGFGVGVVAAALSLFALAPPTLHAPSEQAGESWAARGRGARKLSETSADLLYVRAGIMQPLSGARLAPGDALAVRVTNRGAGSAHLAVFALDAAGDVHWIYPAYLAADEDPVSILVAPGVHGQLLPEVFEPDAPAAGAFRVFALWSAVPLAVRDVERHLAGRSASNRALAFPDTHIQQWRATWPAR